MFPLYQKVLATGEPVTDSEITGETPAAPGQTKHWVVSYYPARGADGNILGVGVVVVDMTEQKRAQQALHEALHARDEFINICSHELKTPITSMRLQFQIATKQIQQGAVEAYAKERVRKRVDLANRQLDRMVKLIDDMLDVSKLAMGRLPLEMENIDLKSVVEEVVDRFSEQFQSLHISLEFHCDVGAVPVVGDRGRLEQVMANLLSNAIKYGAGQPVSVTLSAGTTAHIKVQDRGIGIAPDNLERIFQRYERAISALSISGLGLGLYITRQIVEAHGGKVWAESELGRGSTFTVELPL